jgi:hypothetical protein
MRSGRAQLAAAAAVLAVLMLAAWWYFSDGQQADRAHDAAVAKWESRKPSSYSFDFSYCDGFCAGCRAEITVRDGVARPNVWQGDCLSVDGRPPKIENIFALEERDRADDFGDFEIRYDPYWGFPALVSFTCEDQTDCGRSYEITDFEALD